MAVQLQLENGKINEYRTWWSKGGGVPCEGCSNDPPIYVTVCGLKWDHGPAPYESCNHIGCAVHIAENKIKGGIVVSLLFCVLSYILIQSDYSYYLSIITEDSIWDKVSGLIFLKVCAFAIVSGIWLSLKGFRERCELIEFWNNGTIHGINATSL